MTDAEMIALCAEAIGEKLGLVEGSVHGKYDPLHNDAQAMALVKRFRLDVDSPKGGLDDEWCAGYGDDRTDKCRPIFESSRDLNRAIVECVAKMRQAGA